MQIYVCIKHVPDTGAAIHLTGDTSYDESVKYVINPYDEYAVEEALRIAEAQDSGEVVAVCVGKATASRSVDSREAQVIITGGRPVGSAENLKILYECAEAFGGAVGASRALVDAGHAPHAIQVGQTGRTVSPKLYVGCGISGSVQHFAGMKGSKVIVGINTDKTAPIFGKCDYGLIGDLFEVVPALTRAIKAG